MRALAVAWLWLSACRCGGEAAPSASLGEVPAPGATSPARVLLVGADGLEWSVAAPLIAAGELPNIAKLVETGVYGTLKSSRPTMSPILWTTIATGTRDHGIPGFEIRDGETRRLVSSSDRTKKAFWDILSEHDRRVATVGWWVTWPVEPVNGVMVAQVNTTAPDGATTAPNVAKGALFDGLERQVHPPERETEILGFVAPVERELPEVVQRVYGDAFSGPLDPVHDRLWQNSIWSVRADELYRRIGVKLAGEGDVHLLAVYFGATDVLGHRFWRYMRPEDYEHPPTPEEVARFGDVVRDAYREVDRAIGQLVAAYPAPPTVILVSDHGMQSENRHGRFGSEQTNARLNSGNHTDAPPAFFAAAGPGIRRPVDAVDVKALTPEAVPGLGSLVDVLPTLLALTDAPIAEDARGAVLTDVVDPAWLAAHPVRTVPTHTPEGWAEGRAGLVEDPRESLRFDQLRALGYVE